ncbi:hypothetical protein GCM10022247_20100 [Allokutzneria multivorans]|uniref:Uncharacterized protein n=1 Tax=Allokutzneria multivorans TaxID=1142134 RepID=A0ABP7RMW0_9PSEU
MQCVSLDRGDNPFGGDVHVDHGGGGAPQSTGYSAHRAPTKADVPAHAQPPTLPGGDPEASLPMPKPAKPKLDAPVDNTSRCGQLGASPGSPVFKTTQPRVRSSLTAPNLGAVEGLSSLKTAEEGVWGS